MGTLLLSLASVCGAVSGDEIMELLDVFAIKDHSCFFCPSHCIHIARQRVQTTKKSFGRSTCILLLCLILKCCFGPYLSKFYLYGLMWFYLRLLLSGILISNNTIKSNTAELIC